MRPSIKHPINLVLIVLIAIYTSCNNSVWPGDTFKLSITDGYYQTISGTEERIAIAFKYGVQGTECRVGGYSIQWGEGVGIVDWYLMKNLIPGHAYSINDTFSHPFLSVGTPVVSMQGYL